MLKVISRASLRRSSTTTAALRVHRKAHPSRSRLVTGLSTAYFGLLAGRGFIYVQNHAEFFSPQSPQPPKTCGLRVLLSVGRLNAASSAPQERHRTLDRGQRATVLPSGRSSSFVYGATKPAAKLSHMEHYSQQASETLDPTGQLSVTGLATS